MTDLRAKVEAARALASIDIPALRALHEAATPTPWKMVLSDHNRPDGNWDAEGSGDDDGWPAEYMRKPDAAYIVAACNALPGLLDEVERRDKLITRLCQGTSLDNEKWREALR